MFNTWIAKNYNKKLEPNPKWNGIDLKQTTANSNNFKAFLNK